MRYQDSVTLTASGTPTIQILNIPCAHLSFAGVVELDVVEDLTNPQSLSVAATDNVVTLTIGQDSGGTPISTPADIIAAIASNADVAALISAVALDTLPPNDGSNVYILGLGTGTPIDCPGPFVSCVAFGDPDVGNSMLCNNPCYKPFAGVVNILVPLPTVPDQPFSLVVSGGNTITINLETDGDGNVRTDDYPTNYNSGIIAAIAANPAAAALVSMTLFVDTLPEPPINITLGLDNGTWFNCGGGGGPFSYAY